MQREEPYWVFAPDPPPVVHELLGKLVATGLGLVELGTVGVVPEPF
jgi:hypothetical protein